ncbi:MAG: DNA-binding response regulator [Deltaproteobacteria bacterium]|nr:MAG: DNA-binding response regulator [Deltaproteobacteria bacterium]
MPYTIALVEDEQVLRENYAQALIREGYEVITYVNRPEAEAAFARKLPDLAILDVMLENERTGGFQLCRQIRQQSPTTPIIFLSARDSDLDKVSGLRLGAWDYLSKNTITIDFLPVRISALFAMVSSLKADSSNRAEGGAVKQGNLLIHEERKQVEWQGRPLKLTLTEFWILESLTRHPGHVKSHDQLMEAANVVVTNNAIAAHIRRIREKFVEVDPEFVAIRAEYGMGYRWVE